MGDEHTPTPQARGLAIRGPQDFLSGLLVLALTVFVLWALSRVRATGFQSISPVVFPKLCAYALGICGTLLMLRGLVREGPALESWPLRGMAMVVLAAVTFGALTNTIGYLAAGFLAVVFAGLASAESRLRDLLLLAAGLVLFSYLLFTAGLHLSLPVFRIPGQAA